MHYFIFSDTRSGSTCTGKWIADSNEIPFLDEWYAAFFHEISNNYPDKFCSTSSRELTLNAISMLYEMHPAGAVTKIMYHDFFGQGKCIQRFGLFSPLLEKLASDAIIPIHLNRDEFISAISSWIAVYTKNFHRVNSSISSISSIKEINLTDVNIREILDDYEGRILSKLYSRMILNYYFGSSIIELNFSDVIKDNCRSEFSNIHFESKRNSPLYFEKISSISENIAQQIPAYQKKLSEERCNNFLFNSFHKYSNFSCGV
jgi:hypothetical protein